MKGASLLMTSLGNWNAEHDVVGKALTALSFR